jgi:hypothetical protein
VVRTLCGWNTTLLGWVWRCEVGRGVEEAVVVRGGMAVESRLLDGRGSLRDLVCRMRCCCLL